MCKFRKQDVDESDQDLPTCLVLLGLAGILHQVAQAQTTPTPTITQQCTVGAFKNHPEFITGGSCFAGVSSSSTVASVSGIASGIDSCVSNLTLLQALSAPVNQCGGGLSQAELVLMKQVITRQLNAINSTPAACTSATAVMTTNNNAIATAVATDNIDGLTSLATSIEKLNNDKPCTLGD